MRILMLAQFYPKTIGGEEQHVQDLSIQMTARGHQVAVATLWQEGLPKFEIEHGVRIYRIQGTAQRAAWLFKERSRRHAPPFPDPELTLELRRIVEQEQPEIVHAHNWLVHSFLPLKAWSGAKLVMSLHDYSLVCAKKSMMRADGLCSGPGVSKCLSCGINHYGLVKGLPTVLGNWVMGLTERSAVDAFISVSQATAAGNELEARNLPYQVIPNFVPTDSDSAESEYDALLKQLPRGDFMLFVGDIGGRKGAHVLLDAYAGLKNAPPLVMIGRRVAETPTQFPANVQVLDRWPHGAVMQAWARSMFALVPSVWPEPFGIVVLEAMAHGLPVIASRIGGLADIVVDGETGLLVTPGDPAALRQAIQQLLASSELRARMGAAAKRRVAEYQASLVVPRIEQVYRKLLETKRVASKVKGFEDEKEYLGVERS